MVESIAAQNSLAGLNQDHSLEAERYRLLLSQAERMRLSLMTLVRLRTRIQRAGCGSGGGGSTCRGGGMMARMDPRGAN